MLPRTLLALIIPAALIGCDRPAPSTNPAVAPVVVAILTVHGRIESLPEKDNPASSLTIYHEDIPGWVRGDGTKGMRSMPMAFPVGANLNLEGFAIDDNVEFVIEQIPGDPIPYRVVRIRKLAADHKLDFTHKY
ncbi:MAG: copper-binding protein [Planctomycetota bacterium]